MVILLTIGANCATMAWESPLDEMLHPEGTWKSDFVSQHVESALLARQVWCSGVARCHPEERPRADGRLGHGQLP